MTYLIHTNFTSGEISPRLDMRVQLQKFSSACAEAQNVVLQPQGGATKRTGLRFINEVKDSSKKVRLIPFQFSTETAYVLEFGDGYIRFYMDGGIIMDGESPYEITSPYAEADLYEIQFTQSADVMYLVHPGYEPRKLSRTGHTAWSLDVISFTSQPDEWGSDNWPGSVTFYKQRLCFGGVPSKPQKFWMSVVNSFEDMTTGTNDDDACVFQLVANEVNAIRWMVPGRSLYIGTSGSEWEAYGSAGQITPTDITADRYTGEGSIKHLPVEISGVTLFLHRTGRKLLEFAYTFEEDSYKAPSMTILAEHLTRVHTIRQLAYQNLPHGVVWAPRTDGTLLGFTYLRNQEVMGWHRHVTPGEVEWATTIKGVMEDELWVVVKRTINGSTKRYIERLDPEFNGEDIQEAFYVDSGLSYDGEATKTISGLDHLEGEEVQILADGSVHPPKTVSSGSIELDREASRVHAGLGYTARLKTLDFTGGAPGGTTQSRIHKISRAGIRLHETVGGYLGPDDESMEELLFRTSADKMGEPIPPFSGTKYVDYWDGYDVNTQILFQHTAPLPATVLGLVAQVDTYGME